MRRVDGPNHYLFNSKSSKYDKSIKAVCLFLSSIFLNVYSGKWIVYRCIVKPGISLVGNQNLGWTNKRTEATQNDSSEMLILSTILCA